jgi:glycosyltransferase involved in cell wall biosynthesis
MTLTIFTPTYNRAFCLGNLYNSLVAQSNKDFEWLIIDDGSTDNTSELVKQWQTEGNIKIRYYFQQNAGKSQAHNCGVEMTTTELFVCVDSDDALTPDAVESILQKWQNVGRGVIGILAYKVDKKTNVSVTQISPLISKASLYDAYEYYGMKGDTMLCYKTDIIKRCKFPLFDNERFVPEAYLYDYLDQFGKLAILHKGIYLCEYLEGGYTRNMAKLLKNNPKGYFAFINQRLIMHDKTFKSRFLDSIRYVAMAIAVKRKGYIRTAMYPSICMLAYLPGLLFYNKRYKNI